VAAGTVGSSLSWPGEQVADYEPDHAQAVTTLDQVIVAAELT
jgi:hypothetical protein